MKRLLLIFGAALLLVSSCTSPEPDADPLNPTTSATVVSSTTSSTPITTEGPADVIESGTWLVGTDILPGTYKFDGSTDSCYWSRLSGFGGTLDEIISNDRPRGQSFVTIEASDKGFKTSGCGQWIRVDDASPEVESSVVVPSIATTTAAPDPVPAASAPTIVECLEGTPGPTLMSDGTMQYTDYCFNLLGGPAYLEQESQSGCPAAVCGYGTNSQGQRNPSSGEIQTLHGCQDGYINDPELCGAVAWVENHQY